MFLWPRSAATNFITEPKPASRGQQEYTPRVSVPLLEWTGLWTDSRRGALSQSLPLFRNLERLPLSLNCCCCCSCCCAPSAATGGLRAVTRGSVAAVAGRVHRVLFSMDYHVLEIGSLPCWLAGLYFQLFSRSSLIVFLSCSLSSLFSFFVRHFSPFL